MTPTEHTAPTVASVEEIQQGWHDLALRVAQLEAERNALEKENKTLRGLLERVVEHRQKSHSELVLLLTGLVSKLPINDVGGMVSKLVEHNTQVCETCASFTKGAAGQALPQPSVLKALDQTKRDLVSALKPAVEELIQLDPPLEAEMLRSLVTHPDNFFSPAVVRANRCFVKGQIPRERVVKEFGDEAVVFFNDLTTDIKLNPNPKPDEIVLAFKHDFDAWFEQNPALVKDKRKELQALHRRVQASKTPSAQSLAQRRAFQKLSFILELLHYYENQNTEASDVVFAQRMPALIEQMVVSGPQDRLEEKAIAQAETLLAFIINPDHRLMLVNNIGKGGGVGKTLRYVLRLRMDKAPDPSEAIAEFVRHLIPTPPATPPQPQALVQVLRLLNPEIQRLVTRAVMSVDRIRREDAETLARAVAKDLGLAGFEAEAKTQTALPPEMERQLAWERIKDLITRRADPGSVAGAIRDRLHSKYDADEVKQSWLTLIEADPMSFIRAFCQLPYLPDGRTDTIARTLMESYVSRLTHEKYAPTYHKVSNSLKNMFRAKPDSPTLLNFLALVRWVDPVAANKLGADIGMQAPA